MDVRVSIPKDLGQSSSEIQPSPAQQSGQGKVMVLERVLVLYNNNIKCVKNSFKYKRPFTILSSPSPDDTVVVDRNQKCSTNSNSSTTPHHTTHYLPPSTPSVPFFPFLSNMLYMYVSNEYVCNQYQSFILSFSRRAMHRHTWPCLVRAF
jgi:hypothetical protein